MDSFLRAGLISQVLEVRLQQKVHLEVWRWHHTGIPWSGGFWQWSFSGGCFLVWQTGYSECVKVMIMRWVAITSHRGALGDAGLYFVGLVKYCCDAGSTQIQPGVSSHPPKPPGALHKSSSSGLLSVLFKSRSCASFCVVPSSCVEFTFAL